MDDDDEEAQSSAEVPEEDSYVVLDHLRQTTELFDHKNAEYMSMERKYESSKKVMIPFCPHM